MKKRSINLFLITILIIGSIFGWIMIKRVKQLRSDVLELKTKSQEVKVEEGEEIVIDEKDVLALDSKGDLNIKEGKVFVEDIV